MKRTKEEADVTRQKLLQAALKVFSREGYDASRIDSIAKEAGVTRGALYHHFGGKAALYNTLVDEVSQRVSAVTLEAIEEGGTILDILRRVFVRSTVYASTDAEWRAVNRLALRASTVDPEVEEGRQHRLEAARATLQQVAEGITGGIAEGDIRPDVNSYSAALHFISLQNGILVLWLEDQTLFDLATEAERVIDLFLAGIAVR
jgi:TetR/AcrR family acrAB operon transcriptional repressor